MNSHPPFTKVTPFEKSWIRHCILLHFKHNITYHISSMKPPEGLFSFSTFGLEIIKTGAYTAKDKTMVVNPNLVNFHYH